ncbi:hypothetical protein ACHAXT_003444 [Thalassiosira profunda]
MAESTPDLLGSGGAATSVNLPPENGGSSDNIASALASAPTHAANKPPPAPSSGNSGRWGLGGMAGSLAASARGVVSTAAASVSGKGDDGASTHSGDDDGAAGGNNVASPPTSGSAFLSTLSSLSSNTSNLTSGLGSSLQPLQSMTKSLSQSISHTVTGKNTLPDRTTASQVLMFRQLLHTRCRPGLRLSRKYEGTDAQRAVLHMPWWERGIEQSKKMIISYDNLITRLWLSGAIMPFEKGGYAAADGNYERQGSIDTLINEKGLPPVPHSYWVDRLGFQQDDPVTDFRSGGVLSLAMLVHIVESCPIVHSRFVPKPKGEIAPSSAAEADGVLSLEEIITDDASVLPFGITCINITDMLAKFLMFSKAVDKMDALLSSKPFWKMCIDPNSILVLQEVSLDLLCDVCVEIGRERRIRKLVGKEGEDTKDSGGMPGSWDGKVTVFDFSEIMERTEKRVGDEVLGAGPQNVEELRAIARRVKSKYLMRIQLKEKHMVHPSSPLGKQIPPLPSKESVKNVTSSVIGGVGGIVNMLKPSARGGEEAGNAMPQQGEQSTDVIDFTSPSTNSAIDQTNDTPGGQAVEVDLDGTTSSPSEAPKSPPNPFASAASPDEPLTNDGGDDELDKLSAELGDLTAATAEAFDLLGDDFDLANLDADHSEEMLDAMDVKLDPMAAFAIDDDEDLLS